MNIPNSIKASRIGIKIAFFTFVFSIIWIVLASGIILYFEFNSSKKEIINKILEVGETQSPGISRSLWDYNRPLLETQLKTLVQLPFISHCQINETNGMLWQEGNKFKKGQVSISFLLEHFRGNRTTQIGVLEITPDFGSLHTNIISMALRILGVQTINAFFIAFFILILFFVLAGKPLSEIAAQAGKITVENLDIPIRLKRKTKENKRNDELDILETALNEMRINLIQAFHNLQTSEERLEMALAGANDGIWDWNIEKNQFHFDDRFYTMLGYESKEFQDFFEELEKKIHKDDINHVKTSADRYLAGEIDTFRQEFRILNKKGAYQWIRSKGKITSRDKNNKPLRFIGTHSDINEQKILEKARDDAYRIINNSPLVAMGWRNEPGWPVDFVTGNVEKELGYRHEELTSDTFQYNRIIYPEDLNRVEHEIHVFSADKNRDDFIHKPYRIVKKSGEIKWVYDRTIIKRNEQGSITHYHGVLLDITDQKLAEEENRNLRNYLANIIDSMPSVLIGVDKDSCITQWNRKATQITGISQESAKGQPLEKAYPVLINEMERVKQSIELRQVYVDPRQPRKEKDQTLYEDVTIYPLISNGVEGAVIRVDNVTEQVRMEEMMVQSEKMLSVGGLAAGMAHEINNPLAGMMQTAKVMKSRLSNLEMPANIRTAEAIGLSLDHIKDFMAQRNILEMAETINDSGQRVAGIVNNMLSFARKTDASSSSHHPDQLLDQTIELASTDYDLKKQHDFKTIKIIKEYDNNLPMISCEKSKIQQVLLNVLRNGAEAMQMQDKTQEIQPCFTIRLSAEKENHMLRMEIQDNGPGMDAATQSRVFEPFFTTKPVGVGTGLGLSVSYFIITQNHGGTMDVVSSLGQGSTFIIRLPLEHDGKE